MLARGSQAKGRDPRGSPPPQWTMIKSRNGEVEMITFHFHFLIHRVLLKVQGRDPRGSPTPRWGVYLQAIA